MDLGKVYSAEGAFCLGGLFFIALAFVADVYQHLAFVGEEIGHSHGGGDVFVRVNIPVMGIALIAFGLGMYVLHEHRDRVHFLAYVAGLLILTDGIAHLFAVSDHINVPLYVVGFSVVAVVQVGGGVLFPFLPRPWDKFWILLTVSMIAVYAMSRSFSLPPFWELEETEPLGIFSKAIEVLTLFPLIELVKRERAFSAPTSSSGAAEP
ncbi:MAG: hypothetical protein E6K10_01975 [Methanobacteriota archaeon]|nr:MAG: hypothetical protein E6K10_01975 [Euryarchaeota archaeon]